MDNNKTKVVLSSMLALSVFFGGWMVIKNKSARIEAAKEKSVLLTEKDLLTKEARDLALEKQKFANLSSDRQNRIDELMLDLSTKNAEINRLAAENANLKELRKKVKEFEQVKNELRNEIASLKNTLNGANMSNSDLLSKLDGLMLENEKLNSELVFLKSLNSNEFLVKGVKRSKKITAFASRTKEISLSFDFPEEYLKDLDVNVLTPGGKTIGSGEKELLTIRPTDEATNTVYPSGLKAKRVELILKPEKKFSKGMYKFTVSKANNPVETILLQLK